MIDRGSERRAAGFLEGLAGLPQFRSLALWDGKALTVEGRVQHFDTAVLGCAGIDAQQRLASAEAGEKLPAVYLGRLGGDTGRGDAEVVAIPLTAAEATALQASQSCRVEQSGRVRQSRRAQWRGFRQVAAELEAVDAQQMIEALGILNWHRTHTHCPRCGAATVVENAGWTRRCPQDGSQHFPRTDPAIIVTVIGSDDRVLLGNGVGWEPHRFSTLAGFVEPGESLEQAVAREVFEEVGVRVEEVGYLGSQPWPFPASLMLGFTAYTSDTKLCPDAVELAAARWFSREELQQAVLRGEVAISHRMSIARALIEHWYGGPIEELRSENPRPAPGAQGVADG